MSMIKNNQLCGQAMISYLQQKGFPEVALHFFEDERIRFNIALESGNISVAVASATQINEKDIWYRLGVKALRQEVNNNVMGQFHNVLYLGDVKERVKILENASHLPLAYITASVHGLNDIVERLDAELEDNLPSVPEGKTPTLLMPPSSMMCGGDWPLLRVMKGIFEGGLDSVARGGVVVEEEEDDFKGDWGEEIDMVDVDGLENRDIDAILNEADGEDGDEKRRWMGT
ncbi:unnamed protein product [Cochlearia groenlandica]